MANFDVDRALRRLKPEKRVHLPAVPMSDALIAESVGLTKTVVLPDATTYSHSGQGRLPPQAMQWLKWSVRHCSVALGEIAYVLGRLDPADPRTAARVAFFKDMLMHILPNRVIAPDEDIHIEAGILNGIVARLKGLPKGDHKKHLNDVLIALTANKLGATVITANTGDFALLQQLVPTLKVAYYQAL